MRKIVMPLILIMTATLIAFSMSACMSKDVRPDYAVSFLSETGEQISEITAKRGDEVDAPSLGEKPGYKLYWADEHGNVVIFPKVVAGNETYYCKSAPQVVKNAYKVEFYLENADGKFVLDEERTFWRDVAVDSHVKFYSSNVEGYYFDEHNPLNVLEGKVEAGKTVEIKAYYKMQYVNITLMADGKVVGTEKVQRGKAFNIENVPSSESGTFAYWSLSDEGERFDCAGVDKDTVLHAVFASEEVFSLDVELSTAEYTLVDEKGTPWKSKNFNFDAVEYGRTFVFKIALSAGATGVPGVRVTSQSDGAEQSSVITPVDGVYSVVVKSNVKIEITGIVVRLYNAFFTLSVADYSREWAMPVLNNDALFLLANDERSYKLTAYGRQATAVMPGGEQSVCVCRQIDGGYEVLSQPFMVNITGDNSDYYHYESVFLTHPVDVTGQKSVGNDGSVYIWDKDVKIRFNGVKPLTADYAVTMSLEQIFSDNTQVPHGNVATPAPEIGVYFKNSREETAQVLLYDTGSSVISCSGEKAEGKAPLAKAGSILGRPEWPDCYRDAELVFVKSGQRFYALFSGDGKRGGVNSDGRHFAPTTAVEYKDYLIFYIDLADGTVYYNRNFINGEFSSAKAARAARVIKNVAEMGIVLNLKGGKTNARIYGYGYTTDASEIERLVLNATTTVSAKADGIEEILLNGISYGGERREVPLFNAAVLAFRLPDGKIVRELSDRGVPVKYDVVDNAAVVQVFASGNSEHHEFELTLKEGVYTDETTVYLNVAVDDRFEKMYDLSMLSAEFVNVYTGECVHPQRISGGQVRALLKRGKWTCRVNNGYLRAKPFELSAGEGHTLEVDVLLDQSVAQANTPHLSGGLTYKAADDALHITQGNYLQQDSAVGDITFVPRNQVLEFGYTLTGMGPCAVPTYYYPFLGMFVKDVSGGYMRYVNRENGSDVGFTLASDFYSRTLISLPDNSRPFESATNDYSWANEKEWTQARNYRLDVKVRVDGYDISVWVRTGESLKTSTQWISVFGEKPINIYDWYNSDEKAQDGIRRNYLNTLYSLDKQCVFGITARRDSGHVDDISFGKIWYNIIDRA